MSITPVLTAEPVTSVRLSRGSHKVGRTGGLIPPTGATLSQLANIRHVNQSAVLMEWATWGSVALLMR